MTDDALHIFPFATCERPHKNKFIKQPVSAFINIITCIILLVYVIYCKTFAVKLVLFSFLIFQAWHAYSHMQHIPGYIQANTAHILWYIVTFSVLYAIITLSHIKIQNKMIFIIIILVIIDVIIWKYIGGFFMIMSGLCIMLYVIVSCYYKLPQYFKKAVPYLVAGLAVLLLLLYNEFINCKNMLAYKQLPYHALVEICGLLLFAGLAYLFFLWDSAH